jgi:hypothetical protein
MNTFYEHHQDSIRFGYRCFDRRSTMGAITDRYLTVQQDILETFVDRGQLRQLAEPTRRANGKRIPGLKLDHPRQLALMHALVRFAHIAAGDTFTSRDLHAPTAAARDMPPERYRLASLRSDLSKLRAKGLVERVPHSVAIDCCRTATRSASSS